MAGGGGVPARLVVQAVFLLCLLGPGSPAHPTSSTRSAHHNVSAAIGATARLPCTANNVEQQAVSSDT